MSVKTDLVEKLSTNPGPTLYDTFRAPFQVLSGAAGPPIALLSENQEKQLSSGLKAENPLIAAAPKPKWAYKILKNIMPETDCSKTLKFLKHMLLQNNNKYK